ncbi:hypothetical protein HID58_088036 [Brassica napus]|uniref:BnaC09g33270D protein n=2 Tax=Brassica napus TaxID=3708 RepID=A0A078H2P2_BRANA|nr:hypothetical protein HID58_088036 [Brassica napus]CAF1765018.1 unnamed protein product [Brassica napus]CDY32880.1 BnaC09g33270D [Brassica napus]
MVQKRRRVGLSPADTGVEANECIKIYLVYSKEEVGSPEVPCVNPVDLNDFFDGDGKIHGYQASLHSYADVTYKSTTNANNNGGSERLCKTCLREESMRLACHHIGADLLASEVDADIFDIIVTKVIYLCSSYMKSMTPQNLIFISWHQKAEKRHSFSGNSREKDREWKELDTMKMIVLSSVSCNANLGKVERTVMNFSMIPHHALRLCLKEKRSRACVHIYSMMSMHEEAVALSVFSLLQIDPELAILEKEVVADDCKACRQAGKRSQKGNIRKTIVFLKEMDGLLKIEDILPFFPDFALIDDDFKDKRKIRPIKSFRMIKSHVAKPNNIGQNNFKGDKGITDLKSALQNIFAETIVDNKDEFMKTFSTEKDFIRNMVSNGEVVHSGVIDRSSIDAQVAPEFLCSNPIDVTDPDWHLYLLIQKKEHKEEPLYQIVGFTAVYKFYRYPDRLRMRLSQILVLPSFQGKGFGSYLVEVVNKVATAENVYDLTVEEPSEKFQHIRTCIDINRLRAFDPIKPAIDSAVETLTKGKLSKKAQIPRFTPPLNAIDKVRETLKINKKHFLKCWEILIYLALDPIDKYLDDYTSVITNHVRAGILGKDIEAPKKQVVDVPTSYAAEASFVVFKSLSGEANNGNDVQVDENKPDQEEQLKQLVEERIREIKLVAGKVSKLRI